MINSLRNKKSQKKNEQEISNGQIPGPSLRSQKKKKKKKKKQKTLAPLYIEFAFKHQLKSLFFYNCMWMDKILHACLRMRACVCVSMKER